MALSCRAVLAFAVPRARSNVSNTHGSISCRIWGYASAFQMAVIEYARNVCGLADANSTEIKPDCAEPVIDILPEQKKIEGLGGNMRLGRLRCAAQGRYDGVKAF